MHIREPVVETAEACGITVVIDDKLPTIVDDLRPTLERVRRERPDILVVSGHAKAAGVVARQISSVRIRPPIVAVTHCGAAKIVQGFGAATEGFNCPAQWDSSMPCEDDLFGTAADFAAAMKEAYPDEGYIDVPYQSASAAAAVMVWRDAFERANSFDTETLRDTLATTNLMTFYGRIQFAPTGEIISKPMVLRQVRNGRFVIVPRSEIRGCE